MTAESATSSSAGSQYRISPRPDARDGLTTGLTKDDDCTEPPVEIEYSKAGVAWRLALSLAVGLVFGLAIHKSNVYRGTVLRDQFDFSNNVMLKVFLSATATSALILSIMHTIKWSSECTDCTQHGYTRHPLGIPGTAFGAFCLGAGMAVAGACPGTIWVQLGSGAWTKSLTTLSGGVVGSAAYAVAVHFGIEKYLEKMPLLPARRAVHTWVGHHRLVVGIAAFVALMGFSGVLDILVNPSPFFPAGFTAPGLVWNPVFCGIIIGTLQIPLVLALRKNLGSSSAIMTLLATALFFTQRFAAVNSKRSGLKNWWQVLYMFGAAGGAALTTLLSQEEWYAGEDISFPAAFIGGFLAFWGARIAKGCTSGHGISGAGHLGVASFVSIASMFAGAIFVKNVFNPQ